MVWAFGGFAAVILALSAWWGSSTDHTAETAIIRTPRDRRPPLLRAQRSLTLVRVRPDPGIQRGAPAPQTISGVQRAFVVALAVAALTTSAVFASSSPMGIEAHRMSKRGGMSTSPRGDGSRPVSRPTGDASPRSGDGGAGGVAPITVTHPTPDPTPSPGTEPSPPGGVTNFSGLELPTLGGRHPRHEQAARSDTGTRRRALPCSGRSRVCRLRRGR
jgi:hypothetical protein